MVEKRVPLLVPRMALDELKGRPSKMSTLDALQEHGRSWRRRGTCQQLREPYLHTIQYMSYAAIF